MSLQLNHFLCTTTNTKHPSPWKRFRIIPLNYMAAHMEGRQSWMNLTAQLKDGNTCLQTPGKCFQCSLSGFPNLLTASAAVRKRLTPRFRKAGDVNEPLRRSHLFFSLLLERGNARCEREAPHSGCSIRAQRKAQTQSAVLPRASNPQTGGWAVGRRERTWSLTSETQTQRAQKMNIFPHRPSYEIIHIGLHITRKGRMWRGGGEVRKKGRKTEEREGENSTFSILLGKTRQKCRKKSEQSWCSSDKMWKINDTFQTWVTTSVPP